MNIKRISSYFRRCVWLYTVNPTSLPIIFSIIVFTSIASLLEVISLYSLFLSLANIGDHSANQKALPEILVFILSLIPKGLSTSPWTFLIVFSTLQIAAAFVSTVVAYLSSFLVIRIASTIRTSIFRFYVLSPFYLTARLRKGEIFALLEIASGSIPASIRSQISCLTSLPFLIAYLFTSLRLSSEFLLLALSLSLLVYLSQLLLEPSLLRNSRQMNAFLSESNAVASETFSTIKYIHYSSSQTRSIIEYNNKVSDLYTVARKQSLLRPIPGLISTILPLVLVLATSLFSLTGLWNVDLGQFIASLALFQRLFSRVKEFLGSWQTEIEASDGVQRVYGLLSSSRLRDTKQSHPDNVLLLREFHFSCDGFSYPSVEESADAINVITNVSFTASPGQLLALAGKSGSGKSTVIDLLSGLYYSSKTKFRLNEKTYYIPQEMGVSIYTVPQEIALYSGSLLYNLTLSRDADISDIAKACYIACLDSLIQGLPLGLDTPIGDSGFSLSGGQKQRIAIARAILVNPQILLLDEATSALDPHTAQKIIKRITLDRQDSITIISTHDVDLLQAASSICYIESGRTIACGKFAQIYDDCSGFRQLIAQP